MTALGWVRLGFLNGVTTVAFLRLGIERFQMASEPRVEKLYKTQLILKPAVFIAVVTFLSSRSQNSSWTWGGGLSLAPPPQSDLPTPSPNQQPYNGLVRGASLLWKMKPSASTPNHITIPKAKWLVLKPPHSRVTHFILLQCSLFMSTFSCQMMPAEQPLKLAVNGEALCRMGMRLHRHITMTRFAKP